MSDAEKITAGSVVRVIITAVITVALFVTGVMYYGQRQIRHNNEKDVSAIADEVVYEWNGAGLKIDKNLYRKIDFKKLKKINKDTASWIYIPETKIDSYVMQEPRLNRYKYSHLNIHNRYAAGGSYIFPKEPEENKKTADDAHQLLLGHRMNRYYGEWMFSNLPNRYDTKKSAEKYKYVYMYYPDHSERWKVYAAMDTSGSDMIYTIPYKIGSEKYETMLKHVSQNTRYRLAKAPDKYTRTLILSTCNRIRGYDARFCVVCVPDAKFYYADGRYIDRNDMKTEDQKKIMAEKERQKKIKEQEQKEESESSMEQAGIYYQPQLQ